MVWEINSESEQSGATAGSADVRDRTANWRYFLVCTIVWPLTGNMNARHLSWHVVTDNSSFNVADAEFLAMHSSEGRTDTPICNSLLALTFRESRCSSNQPLPFFIKT
jgi:hypothetical protein